jgi:hypothetical protein
VINIFFYTELQETYIGFHYSSDSSIEERKDEAEDSEESEDPEDEILDFSNVIFDGWNNKGWTLHNGEKVRDVLLK